MAQKVMLDLETLGTKPGSVILSLGAVTDDGRAFYDVISIDSCTAAGLTIDESTVQWWSTQSSSANHNAFRPDLKPVEKGRLRDVLQSFACWYPAENAELWANGAAFDPPLLECAYRAVNIDIPWKFWNVRCYRTLKSLYPDVPTPANSMKHHSLSDAEAQMRHLQLLLQRHNRIEVLA